MWYNTDMTPESIHRTLTDHKHRFARIEVPTDLPYLTRRNWSDALDHRLAQLAPGVDTGQYHFDQPCFLHVDYGSLIETVLERVDTEGKVHYLNALTGAPEVTDPVPRQSFTGTTVEEQAHQRDLLAYRLIEGANQLLRFQDAFVYTPEQIRCLTAHCEGQIAELLAPYRHELHFIAGVSQTATTIR